MVDPKDFGVNADDLSRKLASWLIAPGERFVANHAELALRRPDFKYNELAYLVAVAAGTLLKEGAKA